MSKSFKSINVNDEKSSDYCIHTNHILIKIIFWPKLMQWWLISSIWIEDYTTLMFLREKSNHELALRICKYLKNRQTEEMQAKSFVSLGADYLRKHWKLIFIHWSTFEMFNNTDWGVVVNVILFTKLLCIIAIIEAIARWWHNQPQPDLSWRTKWRRCQNIGRSIFIMQRQSMWYISKWLMIF